ncbi:alpha/beta hydrolase family protein [Microbispora sp. H10885]|uniref:alpha/beta hydrolase family protein n=1 Tax=Microbispora sp. H10885 TaxID=2729110 RepID=UPI001603B461|nr:prolyl oligopeptidase family serine peptidase [Microbispora sp. H10885]
MFAARKLLGLVGVLLMTAALTLAPGPAGAEEVTFTSDGTRLNGTVFAPPGTGHRRPGLVLVSVSGWLPREELHKMVAPFVEAGVVTFVYEKRTAGYSATQRSYSQLADDALAAVRLLRARPDVDPDRVGLWGISEGGWVAPLVAARSPEVGFVVLLAASGVQPARQTAWHLDNLLRHDGVSGPLALNGVRLAEGLGQFPEAAFDPAPALTRVRQPVFAVWGADDHTVPPAESMAVVRNALEQGGNHDYTMRVVSSATHPLARGTTWIVPEFYDLVTAWLKSPKAAGRSDAPPSQERTSLPVEPHTWYESAWAQGGALLLMAVLFSAYLGAGLVGRRRRRRAVAAWGPEGAQQGPERDPGMRRTARLLAVCGLLAPLGLVCYVVALLLTQSTGAVGGVVVPYLALRGVVLLAVAAMAFVAAAWWRARRHITRAERVRLGLLLGGGAVLLPWAAYWGLLFG